MIRSHSSKLLAVEPVLQHTHKPEHAQLIKFLGIKGFDCLLPQIPGVFKIRFVGQSTVQTGLVSRQQLASSSESFSPCTSSMCSLL
jgi:hypothetical protein